MPLPALRLHHRIVIPVVVLALVTTSIGAFVSLSLTHRALETRALTQLSGAAVTVSRGDFALNQTILARVKEITGAEILTYTLRGEVLASTVTGPQRDALLAIVSTDTSVVSAPSGATVVRRMTCGAVSCYVAYTRVPTMADTVVALVEEASDLNAATRAIQRTSLLSAVLGALMLLLVSQAVAERVTRPLARLVAFTRNVASGSGGQRAPVGNDEIGTLAGAFNDMLDRLERAQDTAVRSEKLALAGMLAARVAHDIRNPLSSLKMQVQLLRSRVSTTEGQTMIAAVLRDVDQVESVVRGLLELARPGEVTAVPVPLDAVVRDTVERMRLQLTHHKIVVSEDIPASLPAVPLDAVRFRQALLNIITNAMEAMPSGGALTISASLAPDAVSVALVVCDDGVGIDPAMADRLFDPFVSSKREGVGLGLVNAKSIVESHGGSIHVVPRRPRGTCVTLSLPIGVTTPTSTDHSTHG